MKNILLSFLFLLAGVPSWACSCISQPEKITIKDYIDEDLIFIGKVTKVVRNLKEMSRKQKEIHIQVSKVFRGNISTDTVTVYTSLYESSCSLFAKEGEEWIIWAMKRNGNILTSACSRSERIEMLSKYNSEMLNYFASSPNIKEWYDGLGKKIAEGELIDKKPHGSWKFFYGDGYLEKEGAYIHGKPEGKWIEYDHPAVLIRDIIPKDKPVVIDSLELKKAYNSPKFITHYKNGVKDGEEVNYYNRNFSLYKNGALIKNTYYFRHGAVKSVFEYQKGTKTEVEYYPNGKIKLTGTWENNERKGEFREYNEMGKLLKKRFYK